MDKHKHDINFTMTNGVEAEAYIQNTQVLGIFQYLSRRDFVHIDYYLYFMSYEHLIIIMEHKK